jgi:hypothetical protein
MSNELELRKELNDVAIAIIGDLEQRERELLARIAELEDDKRRLDWMQNLRRMYQWTNFLRRAMGRSQWHFTSLRAAIDDAMQAEAQS